MPVYSYRCNSCGVQFDRRQSFHEAPLKACPECRKRTLVKVLAPVGIVFKGSGFYATDHRSGAARSSADKKGDGKNTETAKGSSETTTAGSAKESSETATASTAKVDSTD
jgi:putative FmdB family regulatory protein